MLRTQPLEFCAVLGSLPGRCLSPTAEPPRLWAIPELKESQPNPKFLCHFLHVYILYNYYVLCIIISFIIMTKLDLGLRIWHYQGFVMPTCHGLGMFVQTGDAILQQKIAKHGRTAADYTISSHYTKMNA